MYYKLQLHSFLFSFIFGIFFFITSYFNNKLIKNKKAIFKYIITFLYIVNIVLIYILLLYKINYGVFHIYFLMTVLVGFIFGYWQTNMLKKYIKRRKSK